MSNDLVRQFRESHHAVARMVAAGMSERMIQDYTGYTHRRLRILLADVAFNDLIDWYKARIDPLWNFEDDIYRKLSRSNMLRAEFGIADTLDYVEEQGERVPLMQLNKLSQDRADRMGYGKHSTVHHNHDFASALDKAIARSGKGEEVKLIDVSPSVVTSPALLASVGEEPAFEPAALSGGEASGVASPPSFAGVLRRRVA